MRAVLLPLPTGTRAVSSRSVTDVICAVVVGQNLARTSSTTDGRPRQTKKPASAATTMVNHVAALDLREGAVGPGLGMVAPRSL